MLKRVYDHQRETAEDSSLRSGKHHPRIHADKGLSDISDCRYYIQHPRQEVHLIGEGNRKTKVSEIVHPRPEGVHQLDDLEQETQSFHRRIRSNLRQGNEATPRGPLSSVNIVLFRLSKDKDRESMENLIYLLPRLDTHDHYDKRL